MKQQRQWYVRRARRDRHPALAGRTPEVGHDKTREASAELPWPPHPARHSPATVIAASATPPRNDVQGALAPHLRRDFQHAGQPLETLSALAFL